jgi:hypothetical protein
MPEIILPTASARHPGEGGLHRVREILHHRYFDYQYKNVMNHDLGE